MTPAPGAGMAWSFNAATGVLSIDSTVNTTPTDMAYGVSNGNVYLSWPADHTGWQMQIQTNNLGTNWFPFPGSIATNEVAVPIDPPHTNAFFCLIYPPQP